MSTAKQEVRLLLDGIPDDATFEDIQYHIYVREKIERGLKDVEDRTRAQRRRRRPGRFRGGDGPQNAEMARRVVWTEAASFDLEEAAGYIARDSRYYAAAFVREVRAAARSPRVSSERGV